MSAPEGDHVGRSRVGVRLSATLTATAVVAAALTISGFLLVTLVERSLISSLDSTALARARDVAVLAGTARLPGIVASTNEDSSVVQVVGPTGIVLASSGNIQGESSSLSPSPSTRRSVSQTLTGLPIGPSGDSFRVVAVPVDLTEGPGWVYVANSLRGVRTTTDRLVGVLVLGLPALLLVVSVVIWAAVGRALRPVERIRERAAAIGGTDLQQRVPVPRSRDELARLAVTMNEMLARLQASAVRQQRFVGDASHELKSPLSALRAQVDVALAYPAQTAPVQVLRRVQQQAERMAELIDDLLFLARSDEGRLGRGSARVDLDELLLAEADRLRRLQRAHIEVVGPDAAAVEGSARDLTRLLRNLGDNALTHARTSIILSLTCRQNSAVLTITDDGPGLPPHERVRVFERFTRLEQDRSRHRAGGGAGLGLAIARQIAHSHGGDVHVQDRTDGRSGASFVVRIPLPATDPGVRPRTNANR